MAVERKTSQLQLRLTPHDKAAIVRAARREGLDVSSYVLRRVVPSKGDEFRALVDKLRSRDDKAYAFAAIGDFLLGVKRNEFTTVLSGVTHVHLGNEDANYLAAMVEHTAHQKKVRAPDWTRTIRPLEAPMFGSTLSSLRLYLLLSSPLAFRRRNIFIDSTVGDRV
ncbi:MAG: plasmid mobilization protein [Gammaproteobacteria bacterium]